MCQIKYGYRQAMSRAVIVLSAIILWSSIKETTANRGKNLNLQLYDAIYRIQMDQPRIAKKALISYQREIEICPSTTMWKNLTKAYTSDGRPVEIMQDPQIGYQWFYTVSCKSAYENRPCRLVSTDAVHISCTSGQPAMISKANYSCSMTPVFPRYTTACRTRYNLVPAFIHTPGNSDPFGFTMVKIPGQCVCVETDTVEIAYPRWLDTSRGDA